ncbi:Mrp/NBP35 ATP-binding protein, partial [Trinorchestia longiramus]
SVLAGVGETIVILSGKGGVGKSTTTVQLAFSLRALGHKVGILDVDLCGPSTPRMLGVEDQDVLTAPDGKWLPVMVDSERKLGVVSIAFFLNSKKDAVIWRGPKKNAMIKQLLTAVAWDVDYLLIDTPPGTSDEHLAVMENIKSVRVRGAVLVTTPQMLSVDDVTRELTFCRKTELKVLGVLENMAGYICPNCSECSNVLAWGGGEAFATKCSLPFLGRVPIEPDLCRCTETGQNFIQKFAASPLADIYKNIALKLVSPAETNQNSESMD